MRPRAAKYFLFFCVALGNVVLGSASVAQVSVTTQHNDQARTGANLSETVLNTSNVNVNQFGLNFSYVVDGSVYAQPLYVPNLAIPGQGTHNVLFVATMNDVLYAFDADSNTVGSGGALWKVDFRNPAAGVTAIPITNIVGENDLNIVGNVGIESTPFIDLTTNTIYLVARTMEVSGTTTNYVARLHALDITTGAEKFGGPTVISGAVPGTGNGSVGGTLTFDSFIQNQRSSLAMANGLILFSWASHEDDFAWHGWVMAYNAQTLKQVGLYCSSPNGTGNGIWMAGRGPVIDASGNAYYFSGNGDFNGTSDLGDSVIKFSTTGGTLTQTDYFTPDDFAELQVNDEDLASSGPLLIPGTSLIIGGGKEALLYLLNTGNLGHEASGNTQIPQSFSTGAGGFITGGGPVFWNRTTGAGPTMYVWADGGQASTSALSAYAFNGTTFNSTPIAKSTVTAVNGNATAGTMSVSANGSTAGTGIVWVAMPTASAGHGTASGVLRAFDANSLSLLWDTTKNATRDAVGIYGKFVPPTVANGKVYLATFSNQIMVYGLLSTTPDFTLSAGPSVQSVAVSSSTTYTVSTGSLGGFTGQVSLSATGLPTGATAAFVPSSIAPGASSTLTITTGASTPVGSATLTITGTSGALTHSVTVILNVTGTPDFSLSATPPSATATQGSSAKYTINATAINSFTGTVALVTSGLPSQATASYSSSSITPGASSTLTITTASTTPTGTYTVTITGTSGTIVHTANVTLNVTTVPVGTAGGISIHFVGNGVAMGATETAGVVPEANWNQATGASKTTGQALVDNNGNATNATVTWKADSIWSLPITDQAGNVRMMEGFLDNATGHTTTVTVSGLAANSSGYTVYVYGDGDNKAASRAGLYQISGTGVTAASIGLTDAPNTNFAGTFTQANNSAGNYVVFSINATGFTISAVPSTASDGTQRAPVNGIQIIPNGQTTTPDFTLSASPATQTVTQGGSTTYTVSAAALNAFSGSVTLAASGLPTGATASFSPASITPGTTSTLTITTATTTPTGSSTLTITGTSGALTHTATATLTVSGTPDFTLSATPATQTVTQGGGTTYTVSAAALNAFSGSVSLAVSGLPTGATSSFSPASITSATDSTLTITTASTTPTGSSTLTITGTSGLLTHTATVNLVTNSIVTSTTGAISIHFVGNGTAMGATETAGVVPEANWNQATGASKTTGQALVDSSGNPTTATVTWKADGIWSLPIADQAGNVRMMEGFLDNSTGHTTTVTVSGLPANSAGYTVYVYGDGDNKAASRAGLYQISGTGVTAASIGLTDAPNTNFAGTFTQANNSAGNYVVFNINASGFTLSAVPSTSSDGTQRAPVNGIQIIPNGQATNPDFTISATPASQTVTQGGSTTYTVSAAALNAFSGSVSLAASGLPTGATASFSPASITPGTTSTLTITTASTTATGGSTLTITGTSGVLTHATTTTLTVSGTPDFTLSATPATQTVAQGGSTTYTVSAAALNAFSGSVTLAASGLPTGAAASFSPTSITPGTTSTLTITTASTTPTGSSTVTITGTSGALTHTTTTTLTVSGTPDFTLSATPATQTVTQGGGTTYTISAAALNAFSGSVSLAVSGLPTGATSSFSPASITPGTSSTLTVTTISTTPTGTPTLTITGTSGLLTHSATVTLKVNAGGTGTAAAISVHFVGNGTAMGSTETAGVVAETNWNQAAGANSAAPLSLLDSTGSTTTATITWAADNTWVLPITDSAGNVRMMSGYLDNGLGHTSTVTVSGLPADPNGYTVYIYADGDNKAATRAALYQISGTGITTTSIGLTDAANTNFAGTFTQANSSNGNYVIFTVSATGFTISAIPGAASDGSQRAPVNSIQIVPR